MMAPGTAGLVEALERIARRWEGLDPMEMGDIATAALAAYRSAAHRDALPGPVLSARTFAHELLLKLKLGIGCARGLGHCKESCDEITVAIAAHDRAIGARLAEAERLLRTADEVLTGWWNSMGDGTGKGPFPGLVAETAELVPKVRAFLATGETR